MLGRRYLVSSSEYHEQYEVPRQRRCGSSARKKSEPADRPVPAYVRYDVSSMPELSGDIRMHWFYGDWDESVGVKFSEWWLWLNTSMLDTSQPETLERDQIDGPHEKKNRDP
ncbi:hypothetical protein DIPPA_26944, partial [Diplonema papillatum]